MHQPHRLPGSSNELGAIPIFAWYLAVFLVGGGAGAAVMSAGPIAKGVNEVTRTMKTGTKVLVWSGVAWVGYQLYKNR